MNTLRDWIIHFAPSWQEMLFWLAVLWIAVGLLRPVVTRAVLGENATAQRTVEKPREPRRAALYTPLSQYLTDGDRVVRRLSRV